MARDRLVDGERRRRFGTRAACFSRPGARHVDHQIDQGASCTQKPPRRPAGWTLLLAAAVALHTIAAPFAKVEESFNLQATHDLLFHGLNITAYDHLEFPGVVPRTFLGAAAVAAAAAPVVAPLRLLGAPKLAAQIAVRLVLVSMLGRAWLGYFAGGCQADNHTGPAVRAPMLTWFTSSCLPSPIPHSLPCPHPQGGLTVASLALLQRAVRRQFGPVTAAAYMLLTALQFHLPFYLSRTLPNVLAMPLTSAGLAAWLDGGAVAPIWLLAAAAVSAGCTELACLPLVCWNVTSH